MTTPTPIPFKEGTAAVVRKLIDMATQLETDYDDEHYSDDPADGHPRPRVLAARIIKSRPFAAFQAAGFAILRSVTGSDKHPFCRQWLNHVHSPVVDAARKGAGILEGFLISWEADALWPSSDEPEQDAVEQKPEDFGKRSI